MDDGASSLIIVILLSLFMVFLNGFFVAKVFFYKGNTYPSFSVGTRGKREVKIARESVEKARRADVPVKI
ncbi:hypothetical protein IT084_08125 [Desulfallas sp. Bu1-1]|jgi:hypothetical protein|uniref:hypothetical protein n=1 Tax=Desulfallas sp. Bu1-1 TaxID=2787620 RepID=UPI0018A0B078|nr:hypothetical protein [Desulfallas sp. Bu1-1]MBF7082940.1 hypothetical protein [Desulfallas sp. Bu1-1]